LPTSLPYLSLNSDATPPITGVSFASGGSGILNETGQNYVSVQESEYLRKKLN
jgi:hypothetical protein